MQERGERIAIDWNARSLACKTPDIPFDLGAILLEFQNAGQILSSG